MTKTKHYNKEMGAEPMDQSVKRSLYKHDDPCSDPRTYINMDLVACIWSLSEDDKQIWGCQEDMSRVLDGAYQTANTTKPTNSKFSERPCIKNKIQRF